MEELADRNQRDAAFAKRTLEALTEAGFVEAHGAARGRTYMLSASMYGAVANKAADTRQVPLCTHSARADSAELGGGSEKIQAITKSRQTSAG